MPEPDAVTGTPSPVPQTPAPPPPTLPATADASSAIQGELEKLRDADLDLRERLLGIREKELFELRQKVIAFEQRLTNYAMIGGVIVFAFAVFGFTKFSDLSQSIDTTFTRRVEDSVTFYDALARSRSLVQSGDCSSALPVLRDLSNNRPEEEVVIFSNLHCLAETEEYASASEYLDDLRAKGIFPRRVRLGVTFNNAGWVVAVRSFADPQLDGDALDLLHRAEQIYAAEGNTSIVFPLYSMMLIHVARGDVDRARAFAARYVTESTRYHDPPKWWNAVDRQWFKMLERRRPSVRQELETLLPAPK